jgi:2-oxoglutarate ferredoxin oxidoreductase subunit alpha
VKQARAEGLRAGLLRPISLWPFPEAVLGELAGRVRGMLVVELSAGQMVEDVRLAVAGRCPVAFHGRTGGMVPSPDELLGALRELEGST